jgi:hypothetical protein
VIRKEAVKCPHCQGSVGRNTLLVS